MKQKLLGGLGLLGALAVLYVFAMPSYRQGEPSVAGRRAPDFTLQANGRDFHLSDLRGKVVLHSSGARDASALDPLRTHGAFVGSMHPLQTFSGVSVPPLDGKVFAVEGDELAIRAARKVARALGGVPVAISAEKKPLYHAAGAFAAGLSLAMEEAGVQMLTPSSCSLRSISSTEA